MVGAVTTDRIECDRWRQGLLVHACLLHPRLDASLAKVSSLRSAEELCHSQIVVNSLIRTTESLMSQRIQPYISPQEYLRLERQGEYKTENLNGEIFAMSGASRKQNLLT